MSAIDYDIGLLRCDYLSGYITLVEFEHQVGRVLCGHQIHECEFVDVTMFGSSVQQLICAKCGSERAHSFPIHAEIQDAV